MVCRVHSGSILGHAGHSPNLNATAPRTGRRDRSCTAYCEGDNYYTDDVPAKNDVFAVIRAAEGVDHEWPHRKVNQQSRPVTVLVTDAGSVEIR